MKEQWKKLSKSEQWGIALTAAACIITWMRIFYGFGYFFFYDALDGFLFVATASLVVLFCYSVFLLDGKSKPTLYLISLITLALYLAYQCLGWQYESFFRLLFLSELLVTVLLIVLCFKPSFRNKWLICATWIFVAIAVWASIKWIFYYGGIGNFLTWTFASSFDTVRFFIVVHCAALILLLPSADALQKSKKKPVAPSCGDELYTLKQQLEQGAITQEEYDAKKQQILDAL